MNVPPTLHVLVEERSLSTMLTEIVLGALDAPDLSIERLACGPEALGSERCSDPDVIVVGGDVLPGSAIERIFSRWPLAALIQLADQGGRTVMTGMRPESVQLGALSVDDLQSVVRRAARRSSRRWDDDACSGTRRS
jgi:hypothetical protein